MFDAVVAVVAAVVVAVVLAGLAVGFGVRDCLANISETHQIYVKSKKNKMKIKTGKIWYWKKNLFKDTIYKTNTHERCFGTSSLKIWKFEYTSYLGGGEREVAFLAEEEGMIVSVSVR